MQFWDQTQGVEDECCTPTLLHKIVPTQKHTGFSCFKGNTLYISSRIKTGLKINEKNRDRIPKFSRNLATVTVSRRIFALHFLASGLEKQNMSLQNLCVKKALKMAKNA